MKYSLLILPILFLSSCLEILEEVNLKNDGSGTLSYTINLSQSKTKINSIMLLDSINGHKIPQEIDIRSKVSEVLTLIEKTDGVSNSKSNLDFDNLIFKFSCDFENVSALNNATDLIKKAYDLKDPHNNSNDHFTFDSSSNSFRRKGDYMGEANLDKIKEEDLASMKDAEFTAIYRFESEIISISNSDGRISPNKKATMLKYPLMDIVTQKKSIENKVILN